MEFQGAERKSQKEGQVIQKPSGPPSPSPFTCFLSSWPCFGHFPGLPVPANYSSLVFTFEEILAQGRSEQQALLAGAQLRVFELCTGQSDESMLSVSEPDNRATAS